MVKKQFLKVRNSLLESEKDFTELKQKDLKDRELKIKREIKKTVFKTDYCAYGQVLKKRK